MHLICPKNFAQPKVVFHFSWVLQPTQEKLKTICLRKILRGGQIRCILGNVEVAYGH